MHARSRGRVFRFATSLFLCARAALAIALSYTLIIVMANALGVVVALTLHLCGLAAVGAPPVVQVVVDVLGITLTCLVCTAVLS